MIILRMWPNLVKQTMRIEFIWASERITDYRRCFARQSIFLRIIRLAQKMSLDYMIVYCDSNWNRRNLVCCVYKVTCENVKKYWWQNEQGINKQMGGGKNVRWKVHILFVIAGNKIAIKWYVMNLANESQENWSSLERGTKKKYLD